MKQISNKEYEKYQQYQTDKDKELGIDGAYTLDKFVDVMKEI